MEVEWGLQTIKYLPSSLGPKIGGWEEDAAGSVEQVKGLQETWHLCSPCPKGPAEAAASPSLLPCP